MSEEQQTPVVLEIRKLYVGDMSVEVPDAPNIFQQDLNPEISLGVAHEITKLPEDNYYNVRLRLTVTAQSGEKTIYLVEADQSGIFEISGLQEVQLHHALNVYCPTVLYPYAREVISGAISRAGFPTLFLQPINFDAMYQQRLQQAAQEQQEQEAQGNQDSE